MRLVPCTVLLLVPSLAHAADIYVGSAETFSTLQDAIDASSDGDVIYVRPGTYAGFEVSGLVDIVSTDGRDSTFITSTVHFASGSAGSTLTGFTFDASAGGLWIEDNVRIETVVLANFDVGLYGAYVEGGATARFSDIDCHDMAHTCIRGDDSYLNIENSSFSGNAQTEEGGPAILVYGGTVSVVSSTFTGNVSSYGGGAILVVSANAFVTDSAFEDNEVLAANALGGAIFAHDFWSPGTPASLTVSGCSFTGNIVDRGVIANKSTGGSLEVRDSSFELQNAPEGCGAVCSSGQDEVVIADTTFSGGGSDSAFGYGAVVLVDTVGDFRLSDVTFSGAADGIGVLMSYGHAAFSAERVLFTENAVDSALYLIPADGGSTYLEAVATCGNPGAGSGFHLLGEYTYSDAVDPIDVRQLTMTDAVGPVVGDAYLDATISNALILGAPEFGNHVSWSYVGTDAGTHPASVTQLDARLGAVEEGGCSLAMLQPAPLGPAADSGDPSVLDRDGSRSNLGALGGPKSFLLGLADDADQDGVGWYHDCADDDGARFPGNTEVPYDGVDGDCDGADLCDVDADGEDAEACGGTDCNDEDGSVHPGAEDILDDGIDQDCEGGDAVTADDTDTDTDTDADTGAQDVPDLHIAGACATGSRDPVGLAVLVLVIMVSRRARESIGSDRSHFDRRDRPRTGS